jgi:hypothetical protein
MRFVMAFLFLTYSCWGQQGLDALQDLLVSMRVPDPSTMKLRGASPKLTTAKHLLRDWVEARLRGLPPRGDEAALQIALNAELRAAGLVCGYADTHEKRCGSGSFLGYIGEIQIFRRQQFLLWRSRVGIECGFDDSVYLYQHATAGWQGAWQNEQNNYTEDGYLPQLLVGLDVAESEKANAFLVLTLGTRAWCSSIWQPHYTRVFHLGPNFEAKTLLDESEFGVEGTLQGSLDKGKVLTEYSVHSVDGARHSRRTIRAFEERNRNLKRVQPVALSPEDFVEEWITHPWPEVQAWSEARAKEGLKKWHEKLPDLIRGKEFIYPPKHCPSKPDLWQVGFDKYFTDLNREPVYLLVRWRPPYKFSLVDISRVPWSMCSEPDPAVDESRTLFPGRRASAIPN